ncbi:hypothetical protein FRC11_004498 [Ceratobasidium sp. 423]|nr:hypothetical protein FRC11_004498 [Ceratobasidium sp. 423]
MNIPLETTSSRHSEETLPRASSRLSGAILAAHHTPESAQQDTPERVSIRSIPQLDSITNGNDNSRSITPQEDGIQAEEHSSSVIESSNLHPADRGLHAWLYLLGAFVVETLVWGFPNSFGVFLSYYSKMYKEEKGAELLLPLAALADSVTSRRGIRIRRLFALRSYAEWFYAKRGLANGVMNAGQSKYFTVFNDSTMHLGTAVGGLVLPLVLPSIIRPRGTSSTLRYLSIAVFVLLSAVLPFIRPRLPEDRVRYIARSSGTRWSTNKSFWLLLCVTVLQGFAYFLPIIYLPTFAQDMKLGDSQASLALALLNGSSVISRVALGHLSDIFNPWVLTTLTLAATSVATFVLWGALVTTIGTLSVYSILFGALAGGYSSLWTGFVRPIARDDTTAATSMLGMLMLSRGLGNVLSTPISSVLISGTMHNYVRSGLQSGSRWANLIIYIGTIFAGATSVGLFGWLRDRSIGSTQTR